MLKELARVFKGLADESRLRILNLLLQGELCVCDIQFVLGSSQPNVSRHLTYLKNAGLVLDRREGTRIYYRLAEGKQVPWTQLVQLLQAAAPSQPLLLADLRQLKKAIRNGHCTQLAWRPPAAQPGGEAGRHQ